MNDENIQKPVRDILIVDDSFDVRAMLKEVLRMQKITNVDEARDEDTAIEKLYRFNYKLIFLDIELESGNGITVLKRIKENIPRTKVIMVSGFNTPDNVRKAIINGADGFIAKPFTPAKILSILDDLALAS
ncbi:response regulator [Pleionea sediminis]|uniref:response regulator n=1 Tax=Pleionea sediminis TaxID=2569479 RepID=UPI0011860E5D|nr:response regulator [Pleionea sediminis]